MDENTIFQGVSPATPPPAGAPPGPPVQPPPPVTPVSNFTPQPITPSQALPVQPLPAQPVGVPSQAVSSIPVVGTPSIPPPPVAPPSSGSRSFLTGGVVKAIIGVVVVLIVGILLFSVVLPLFSNNKNEKVTLTYWGLWEDPNVMQKAIDDFQKENPNIIVKYEKQDIKQQYKSRLLTRIKNGNGPDIFQFHNTWVSQMNDYLTPIPTDVITPADFRKAYYPVIASDVIKNGAIYGIPLQIDTLALYTNTDLLEASSVDVPTNWEDFGKDARMLTVKDENGKIQTAGAALGTYDNITHAPDILSLLFIQNGANIFDLSSTSTQSTDTLTYYTDYAGKDSNVWDSSLDPSLLAFAKGNLALYFGYSWDLFAIQAMNPSLHFQITPVPHLALGRKVTIASYWVEGVSQRSKHQKQAMLFMKYLSKKETLQKLFTEASKTRAFGQLYPRPDLADSLKDNKLLYPFVSQADTAVSSFFVSDTYDEGLNQKADTYLGKAVSSILDNTSVESALETLSAGVAQVLRDYGYTNGGQ
jgi:ABC-type glycerol-3-phosphate transport system substrate-binding protein